MKEIDKRKLPVNMIVVSDHGMTRVEPDNHIRIESILPEWRQMIEWIDFGPVTSIWPKKENEQEVFEALKSTEEHFQVYKKGEFPEKWKYDRIDSPRIPPILVLCEVGYVMDYEKNQSTGILGYHGYDPETAEMRAIFLARGPDISTDLLVRDPVLNVDLYPMMTRLLSITSNAASMNGTEYLANLAINTK